MKISARMTRYAPRIFGEVRVDHRTVAPDLLVTRRVVAAGIVTRRIVPMTTSDLALELGAAPNLSQRQIRAVVDERMPQASAFVSAMEAEFGPVKILHAVENSIEVGKALPPLGRRT